MQKQDILAIDVTDRKGDLHSLVQKAVCAQFDGSKRFKGCADWTDRVSRTSCFDRYLSSRTAVILQHPNGAVVSRSSGDILGKQHERGLFIEKGI